MKRVIHLLLVVIVLCGCSQGNRKTAVVAHRGYWNCEAGGLSENSIAALKAAQDNGFWGSECDVQLTADSFISFSLHITTRLAELAPGFLNQYLNGDLPPEALHSLGIDGLDYEKRILEEHQKWVEQARSLGMSTNVWTVDKREDIELMAAINPDAITTNAPLLVREVLGRNELK